MYHFFLLWLENEWGFFSLAFSLFKICFSAHLLIRKSHDIAALHKISVFSVNQVEAVFQNNTVLMSYSARVREKFGATSRGDEGKQARVQGSRSGADARAHLGAPCVSQRACKCAQTKAHGWTNDPLLSSPGKKIQEVRGDAQSKGACYIKRNALRQVTREPEETRALFFS